MSGWLVDAGAAHRISSFGGFLVSGLGDGTPAAVVRLAVATRPTVMLWLERDGGRSADTRVAGCLKFGNFLQGSHEFAVDSGELKR